jgi:WD40 repeat protein
VRIWSADGTGEPIVLYRSRKAVNSASWSPDGERIVVALEDKSVMVFRDVERLRSPDDPALWAATTYCMPLEVRKRLLGFPEEVSRNDLERCERRVREATASSAPR